MLRFASQGFARISHQVKLIFSTFTKYEFEKHGGEGVDVYVIDTGINVEHTEFYGRASWGKTIPVPDVDEDSSLLCRHQVSVLLATQLVRRLAAKKLS